MKQLSGRSVAYSVFSVLLFLLGPGCLDSRSSSTSDFEIWVVDQEGGTIRAFDPTTHAWLGDVVELDAGVAPSSVALHGDRVMVTDFASGELLSIDLQPGAPAEVTFRNGPPGSTPRLEEPCAVEIVDESAWVLGNDSRNLLSFGDGQITEMVDEPYIMRNPHSFLVSPEGWLFVATSPVRMDLGMIQIWDPYDMKLVDHFGLYGEILDGTGLAYEPSGTVLVADFFGNQVVRYDPSSGELLEVVLDDRDGLHQPVAVEVDPMGAIYVLDRQSLLRVQDTDVEELFTHAESGLEWPRSMTIVSDMQL
jgi:DNA-binding beta-propeller fold protein YncE